ncbi:hypothetical protein [Halorussus salinisoli]|uniref:hypothetical protein n=1 Tax=Halorussus salinisoli TaxID=2558242 RepID=UPI0010C191FB|nr:hypothetical protein [Halorussus salinisoli]
MHGLASTLDLALLLVVAGDSSPLSRVLARLPQKEHGVSRRIDLVSRSVLLQETEVKHVWVMLSALRNQCAKGGVSRVVDGGVFTTRTLLHRWSRTPVHSRGIEVPSDLPLYILTALVADVYEAEERELVKKYFPNDAPIVELGVE